MVFRSARDLRPHWWHFHKYLIIYSTLITHRRVDCMYTKIYAAHSKYLRILWPAVWVHCDDWNTKQIALIIPVIRHIDGCQMNFKLEQSFLAPHRISLCCGARGPVDWCHLTLVCCCDWECVWWRESTASARNSVNSFNLNFRWRMRRDLLLVR